MIKKIIFKILVFIGVVNALTIVVSAITGTNAYTIANGISDHLVLMLCVIPISLTTIAILWWLVDLYLKVENRVNYILIAFTGILADAIFVIGSLLFAEGH